MRVDEAGYVLHLVRDLVSLGVEHVELGAVDAHDDGFARARQYLLTLSLRYVWTSL